MSKIKVKGNDITVINQNGNDYISLTDMLQAKDGDFFITDWLRNRNTLEFLSIWETINNPNFNYGEFAIIRSSSGLNSFKISVKEWVAKTNAIGLSAKAGRYGGTYAHKDIAFEFGTWISPEFKLYLIKEFQRLKDEENKQIGSEWNYRRFLSKVNYRLHTDAIKLKIIPEQLTLSKEKEAYIYANEAELLNVSVFGMTSKQWREENPKEVLKGHNIRDLANIPQLTVLANLESTNSLLIKQGMGAKERFEILKSEAVSQLRSLQNYHYTYPIESPHREQTSTFDENLKKALNYNPKED